jgi:4-amino-4-deoxy-L-arabinose transferase
VDPWGLFALVLAAAASAGAWASARRGRRGAALALLLLAALSLRANLAAHRWLAEWDERYHAVVARNLLDHPLLPTLVEYPLADEPPGRWRHGHVWLHKPPLALWLMSASLALFGENELALRVPSVVLGTVAVALTYLLALRLVASAGAAWLAAAFHAWHARSALLSGGLRATDHVDALMAFWVELAALLGILAADALAERRRSGWPLTAAAGLALGAALLTKDAPALVALAVFGVRLLQRTPRWVLRLGAPALALAIGAACVLPWRLYAQRAFPIEAAYSNGRAIRYFTKVVDGQGGPWFFHLANLPDHYGALAPVAVALLLLGSLARRREWLPLAAWIALVYGVFSAAQTKMESYVAIASPVVFVAYGILADAALRSRGPRARRAALATLAGAAAIAVAWASLRAHRPTDPRPRDPLWARELRALGERVRALPGGPWIVFGVPSHEEARFYARAGFESKLPEGGHLAEAGRRGYRVAVYGDPEDPSLRALAAEYDVAILASDPRTATARRALALASRHDARRVRLFGVAAPADLEEYLHRAQREVRWSARAEPEPSPEEIRRGEEDGALLLVCDPAGGVRRVGRD